MEAVVAVGGSDREKANNIAKVVVEKIAERFPNQESVAVESIQDIVEEIL